MILMIYVMVFVKMGWNFSWSKDCCCCFCCVEWLEGEKWATRHRQSTATHLIAVYRTIAVVTDRQLLRQEQELKIFIAATLLRWGCVLISLTININCIGWTPSSPSFLSLASTHDGLAVIIIAPFNGYRSGTFDNRLATALIYDWFVSWGVDGIDGVGWRVACNSSTQQLIWDLATRRHAEIFLPFGISLLPLFRTSHRSNHIAFVAVQGEEFVLLAY